MGVTEVGSVEFDLVIGLDQESLVLRYHAGIGQERGDHVHEIAPARER